MHVTAPDGWVTWIAAQYLDGSDEGESVVEMLSVSMMPMPVAPEKTRLVAPARRVRNVACVAPREPS